MDTLLIGILFVVAVLVIPSLIDRVRNIVSKEEKGVAKEKSEEEKEKVEKEVKEEKKKTEVQEITKELEKKEDTKNVESLDIEKTNIIETKGEGEEIMKDLTQDYLKIDTSDIDSEFSLEVKEEEEKEVKLEESEEVKMEEEGILQSEKDNILESLEKVIETEEEGEIDLLRDLKGQKFDIEELQAELSEVLDRLKKIRTLFKCVRIIS